MNKKTILMAPLAVLAMGLTACNKGWPTIADEKAKEVAGKISAAADELLKDKSKYDTLKVTRNENSKSTLGKSNAEYTSKEIESFDAKNLYYCDNNEESSKSNAGSYANNTKDYRIFENNEYKLHTSDYSGRKTDLTKEQLADDIRNEGYEAYTKIDKSHLESSAPSALIYVELANFDALIETQKALAKEVESIGNNSYYKYHFESQNEKSLRFVTDGRINNVTELPEEFKDVGIKEIEYYVIKSEWVIENNYVTKIYNFAETKGKTTDGKTGYSKAEVTYSYEINGTISRDSINLSDYTIE